MSASPQTDVVFSLADMERWAKELSDSWTYDGGQLSVARECPAAQYVQSKGYPDAVVGGETYSLGPLGGWGVNIFPNDGLREITQYVDGWCLLQQVITSTVPMTKGVLLRLIERARR